MTASAQEILDSFDALADAEKHQVAVQILRRYQGALEGDVSDAALVMLADELFQALDAEEQDHASS